MVSKWSTVQADISPFVLSIFPLVRAMSVWIQSFSMLLNYFYSSFHYGFYFLRVTDLLLEHNCSANKMQTNVYQWVRERGSLGWVTFTPHSSSWEYWAWAVLTLHTRGAGLRCPWDSRNAHFSPQQKENSPAESIIELEGAHRGICFAWVCLCAGNASMCGQDWGDFTVIPQLRWDSNVAKAFGCCALSQNVLCTKVTGWHCPQVTTFGTRKGAWGPESLCTMQVATYSWEGLHCGVLSQLGSKEWKMSVWHPSCLELSWGSGSQDTLAKRNCSAPAPNAVKSSTPTLHGWGKRGTTDPAGLQWTCAKSLWYTPWCCCFYHSVVSQQ